MVPRPSSGGAAVSLFLVPTPGLRAYALARTPPELRIRGVFLDAADLESV